MLGMPCTARYIAGVLSGDLSCPALPSCTGATSIHSSIAGILPLCMLAVTTSLHKDCGRIFQSKASGWRRGSGVRVQVRALTAIASISSCVRPYQQRAALELFRSHMCAPRRQQWPLESPRRSSGHTSAQLDWPVMVNCATLFRLPCAAFASMVCISHTRLSRASDGVLVHCVVHSPVWLQGSPLSREARAKNSMEKHCHHLSH